MQAPNTIQENLPRIETEFFDTHGIQRVSVNGQECFHTPVIMKKLATDLKPDLSVIPPPAASVCCDYSTEAIVKKAC